VVKLPKLNAASLWNGSVVYKQVLGTAQLLAWPNLGQINNSSFWKL